MQPIKYLKQQKYLKCLRRGEREIKFQQKFITNKLTNKSNFNTKLKQFINDSLFSFLAAEGITKGINFLTNIKIFMPCLNAS